MKYNFFSRNANNLYFEWNSATATDWLKIKRGFVDSYLFTYMNSDNPSLGAPIESFAQILWQEACISPRKQALELIMNSFIKPLQCYLFYEKNPLHNEINAIKEYLIDKEKDISAIQEYLIKLFKIRSYFEEIFEHEKNKIHQNNTTIEYLVLKFHEQPIAFFTCELNYKSGYTYLRFINIAPSFNRLGLAKIILAEVSKHYPESLGLELYARKDNLSALAFYNNCGFQKFEQFDFKEPAYPHEAGLHFPQNDATDEPAEHIGFQRRLCG